MRTSSIDKKDPFNAVDYTVLDLVTNGFVVAFKELCFLLFTILSFKVISKCCVVVERIAHFCRIRVYRLTKRIYMYESIYLLIETFYQKADTFGHSTGITFILVEWPYPHTLAAKPVFPVQQVSRCRNISVTWAIT